MSVKNKVLSLTAKGALTKLREIERPVIKRALIAISNAHMEFEGIVEFAQKASADRRRTEYGREVVAAEYAANRQKEVAAQFDKSLEEIRSALKRSDELIAQSLREQSDTERQHFAEIRALVRAKTKSPASVNLFVRSSDAVVGRAVLSAPLVLSNSDENEREKMTEMYLAKHEPGIYAERSDLTTAYGALCDIGDAFNSRVMETVNFETLRDSRLVDSSSPGASADIH